jgi:hypothetical protein
MPGTTNAFYLREIKRWPELQCNSDERPGVQNRIDFRSVPQSTAIRLARIEFVCYPAKIYSQNLWQHRAPVKSNQGQEQEAFTRIAREERLF